MRVLNLLVAFAVSGCAAPSTWQHPGLTSGLSESQRAIDTAECTALAVQSIALPNPPAPPITVNVYANGIGSGAALGGNFDFGAQASSMQNAINQSDDHYAAVQARANFADACMLKRGWVKTSATQQQNFEHAPPVDLQPQQSGVALPPDNPTSDNIAPPTVAGVKPPQRYDAWQTGHGN